MRRQLMVGTALAAATMLVAGGALAADKKMMKPSISVNGYFESVVGMITSDTQDKTYSYMGMDGGASPDGTASVTTFDENADPAPPMGSMSTKADTSAADTRTDAEIHFNGRATLDNGLKVHARVELEGQNNHSHTVCTDNDDDKQLDKCDGGDPIDEYFLSVSGSFGQVILGGTGGAPVKMLGGVSGSWATQVGENLNFDNAWIPSAAGNHYGLQHIRLDTGDAEKITYISPKLGGFQVGATYSPNMVNNDNNSRIKLSDGPHDGIELAASYTGKFGDVGFGVGAGMTSYQGADGKADDGRSDWLVGAKIGFGPVTVSAAHKRVTNDNEAMHSSLTDVGVRFVSGANSFSLAGSQGQMENTDAEHRAVMASYARALGPGVKWHANVIWNDTTGAMTKGDTLKQDGTEADPETEDYIQQYSQQENSGMALVTGIVVVF